MTIAAVILAAGLSSRMGQSKPLLQLGGQSLLARCQAVFTAAGLSRIVAVFDHRAGETAAAEALGLRWVVNGEYHQGMFSSIRCGVAALIPAILAHDGNGGLKGLLARYPGVEVAVWDEGILLDADTPDDLAVLARRLDRISIPTKAEAEALAAMLLPAAGLAHGRQVGRAAVALAEVLNARGYGLDLELVYGAALLHDVAKGHPQHERRGAEMLAALGLPEIAAIAAVHNDSGQAAVLAVDRPGEKEVVYLADRVFRGPQRVDLEARYGERLAAAGDDAARRQILGWRIRARAVKALVERAAGGDLDSILTAAGL